LVKIYKYGQIIQKHGVFPYSYVKEFQKLTTQQNKVKCHSERSEESLLYNNAKILRHLRSSE